MRKSLAVSTDGRACYHLYTRGKLMKSICASAHMTWVWKGRTWIRQCLGNAQVMPGSDSSPQKLSTAWSATNAKALW